jgi:hypothetical protein
VRLGPLSCHNPGVAIFGWVLAVVGVGVVVANLRTMRPLWRSPALERSQKLAQTALMWIIPGSYLVVRQAIMTPGTESPRDATGGPASGSFVDWSASTEYRHNHSFDDGPHHGVSEHHDVGSGHDGGGGSD